MVIARRAQGEGVGVGTAKGAGPGGSPRPPHNAPRPMNLNTSHQTPTHLPPTTQRPYTPRMNEVAPRTWEPRLPLEIALDVEDPMTIAARHGLDLDGLNALLCTPAFQAQVAQYRKELHETGEVFRAKARVQAELLLDKSFTLIHDPSTPANVKADLIKSTVEWAGLKPTGKASSDAGQGQFSITFNFPVPSGAPAPELPKAARPTITVDNVGG